MAERRGQFRYYFTTSQLAHLLEGTVEMYNDYLKQGKSHGQAKQLAVYEMFGGLEADRRLISTEPGWKLTLQLPDPKEGKD